MVPGPDSNSQRTVQDLMGALKSRRDGENMQRRRGGEVVGEDYHLFRLYCPE
jgi:hypothetical protein